METAMIPIIDISAIGLDAADTKDEDLKSIGGSIRNAFQTVGFCYISNHGIDKSVIDEYMDVSQDFFNQPEDRKRAFERKNEAIFGWAGFEKETLNIARPGDLKECFNFKPSAFPDSWVYDEMFRKLNMQMFERLSTLALRICDALSLALGLDKNFFRKDHDLVGNTGNETTLRPNLYPELLPEKEILPGQLRCGEHTDFGTITLLYQDNSGGLEINVPEKGYVAAPPVPGTLLINIGALMQRWTADDLLATEHRVVMPEKEEAKQRSRQSIAYFLVPDNDAVIRCTDGSDKYKPIASLEYLMSRLKPVY